MGFRDQGNKAIYFRRTREQKSKTEGNRGTKAIFWNIQNQNFDFGEQGKMPIFSGEQENRNSPAPGRASLLVKQRSKDNRTF